MRTTYPDMAFKKESYYEESENEPQMWELKIKMKDQATAKAAADYCKSFIDNVKDVYKGT